MHIPLVVECLWDGAKKLSATAKLSKKVATQLCGPLNEVISTMIYSRLSLTLMWQNARAILARCVPPPHLVTFLHSAFYT